MQHVLALAAALGLTLTAGTALAGNTSSNSSSNSSDGYHTRVDTITESDDGWSRTQVRRHSYREDGDTRRQPWRLRMGDLELRLAEDHD